jgi:PKD repeat protein
VTLRVTDDEGATDTDTATVSVTCGEQDPTADAGGPYNADVEQIVTFDGSGSYDNDESGASIVQYDWKFFTGDSWHNGLGPNPTHAYMSEGTYTVTLRVTDDEGATDTDTTTVTVGDIPTTATIEMEDVDIEFDETTGDGYLKAKDVDDDVGSCEVTLSWDPTVANVVNVDDSDFEVIYWYADEAAGTITVIASNNNIALTGNFNIGKIHFEQVGTNGDSCDLTIEDSEMLTDDPQPSSIAHGADNGRLRLLTDVIDSGDMNGDGNVNSGDVRYLALYLAGDPDYNPLHDDGDVNSDGNVNSGDVRYLALYLAGDPDYSPLYP